MNLSASAKALASVAEDNYLPIIEPETVGKIVKTPLAALNRRIKRAFCEPGNVSMNPLLDLFRLVIIPDLSKGGK